MALILILRRDPRDLSTEEKQVIEACYPGETVEYQRIDPIDHRSHYELCRSLAPSAVILPAERPIPVLAMEHGYHHVAVISGRVMELVSINTEFKPFAG
jgi:hypothetical protein